MSLSAAPTSISYIGTGAVSTYSFPFKGMNKSYIKVRKRDASDNEIPMVLDVDFTVANVTNPNGGSITLTAGNLPLNYTILIERVIPLAQDAGFRTQGTFSPEVHDDAFDKAMGIAQQIDGKVTRSLFIPATVEDADGELETWETGRTVVTTPTGFTLSAPPSGTAVDVLADLASTEVNKGSYLVTYQAPFVGAAPRTLLHKNAETICITDFYANGVSGAMVDPSGLVDSTGGIQAALTACPSGGRVIVPPGRYRITDTLDFVTPGTSLEGDGYSGMFGNSSFFWDGVTTGGLMIKILNGKHNCSIKRLWLDANLKADACLFVEALNGSSTHNPKLEDLTFIGYKVYGLILGEWNVETIKNGQMGNIIANNLQWRGGGVAGTTACLVNAQNIETLDGNQWYFDPFTDTATYYQHAIHIKQVSGGIRLSGLLTTRATSYAIDSADSVAIYGWRAEDRLLFYQQANNTISPSTLSNVVQRYDASYSYLDTTINLNAISTPTLLMGVTLQGSLRLGATDPRVVVMLGVTFPYGGGIIYAGPSNVTCFHHDTNIGMLGTRGTAPGFQAKNASGSIIAEHSARVMYYSKNLPSGGTPSVADGTVFTTSNVGATNVSILSDLQYGQMVILKGGDGGLTTITDTATIMLAGSVNFVLGDNDTITFIGDGGGNAIELCRSNN